MRTTCRVFSLVISHLLIICLTKHCMTFRLCVQKISSTTSLKQTEMNVCAFLCWYFFFVVAFWRRRRQLTDQFSSTVFRIGMIQSFTSFVIYSNDKRSQKYSHDTQYSHTNHNLSGCRKWRPVISAYKSKECKFESSKFWILWEMWWRLVSGKKIMYAYIFVCHHRLYHFECAIHRLN